MRTLTTADIAFLLCTSQSKGGDSPFRLTLETDYGLVLVLGTGGSISASLRTPDTTTTTTTKPRFGSSSSFPSSAALYPPPTPIDNDAQTSIDAILLASAAPSSPSHAAVARLLALPGPEARRKHTTPLGPGYKYRIVPDLSAASYMSYVPGWAGNPPPPPTRHDRHGLAAVMVVSEDDLERRYSLDWFDAYLDWIERLERAAAVGGNRRMQDHIVGDGEGEGCWPFADEGERVLWMVEGLLLACWLGLQPGVAGVEYQPGEEVYMLDKESVGEVLQGFLDAVWS
ncbi:hypothetical protein B0T22DRAFT_513434 [Podospora appendiculata]|uniref:Uncharacterized protein n=1 Tax=Podospora appendiculata TaxID=314037 RepID=A0AAE0XAQ2_9PEZI|nr:hypothetical protein B0T22DRAFT_513434 [Podospora appendiculata]